MVSTSRHLRLGTPFCIHSHRHCQAIAEPPLNVRLSLEYKTTILVGPLVSPQTKGKQCDTLVKPAIYGFHYRAMKLTMQLSSEKYCSTLRTTRRSSPSSLRRSARSKFQLKNSAIYGHVFHRATLYSNNNGGCHENVLSVYHLLEFAGV